MNAPTKATAVHELAALNVRVERLKRDLEALTSRRAEAERTLARALADGAPEQERRALSDAVARIDREATGLPGAIDLLEADRPALQVAAHQEKRAAADAEADRLQDAYTEVVRETVVALREAASIYLVHHQRMHGARAAAVEARRASLRLTGADRRDVFYAAPDEPRFEGDEDFYTLGRLLALYGAER